MKIFYYFTISKELIQEKDIIQRCITNPYLSSEYRVKVVIGQNRNENNLIVKEGDQNDWWFHVANHPSGHGLYCDNDIKKEAIELVAIEVKQQSKLKNLNKVSINFTQLKYVKNTKEIGKVILKKNPFTIKI